MTLNPLDMLALVAAMGVGKTRRPDVAVGQPVKREGPKVGRNAPCPCNSGRKYKKCHGGG